MTEHRLLDAGPLPLKLRVEDYLMLHDAGALSEYHRTELIDGTILVMNAAYSRHSRIQSDLFRALDTALRQANLAFILLIEPSVLVDGVSLPQPDLAIFREVPEDGVLPLESVALLVEVADSSRGFDLGQKAALYARADIAEYWVADTTTGLCHQMWRPEGGAYVEHRRHAFGTVLVAATLGMSVTLPAG